MEDFGLSCWVAARGSGLRRSSPWRPEVIPFEERVPDGTFLGSLRATAHFLGQLACAACFGGTLLI